MFCDIASNVILSLSLSLPPIANRRAGNAVTSILAKELLQEPTAAKKTKVAEEEKKKEEKKKEDSPEEAGSLEDLLEAAATATG